MKIQIDDEVRDATNDEILAIQEVQSAPTVKDRALENQAVKSALLERLGLTSEEAALLLS
jgi:hypothetical protein